MENEYCPFQETCRYAKDYSLSKNFSSRTLDKNFLNKFIVELGHTRVLYECKALKDKPKDRTRTDCSYLNNLNRTIVLLYNVLGIE